MLLQLVHRLPDLRDCPLGAEFGVAVTVDLTPSPVSYTHLTLPTIYSV